MYIGAIQSNAEMAIRAYLHAIRHELGLWPWTKWTVAH